MSMKVEIALQAIDTEIVRLRERARKLGVEVRTQKVMLAEIEMALEGTEHEGLVKRTRAEAEEAPF